MKKIALGLFVIVFLISGCASTRPFGVPDFSSRQKYVQSNLRLSGDIKQAILDGRIVNGMTKEQVLATWGKPSNSNDQWYGKYGEGWWYKNFFGSTHFVEFNSGRVTSASSYFK